MEWFGITCYGFQDPIKDMMREDYKEPTKQPNLLDMYEKGLTKKSLAEIVAEVDCYIGPVDGFAYQSIDRLNRMKKKGVTKPVGPTDMYKYAGTNQMNFGWSSEDPVLKNETWHKRTKFYPVPFTDVSGYYNQCLKIDKFFRL